MTYKFICTKCGKSFDINCSPNDYDKKKQELKCDVDGNKLERDIADFCTAPLIVMNGGYGIDGNKGWKS